MLEIKDNVTELKSAFDASVDWIWTWKKINELKHRSIETSQSKMQEKINNNNNDET